MSTSPKSSPPVTPASDRRTRVQHDNSVRRADNRNDVATPHKSFVTQSVQARPSRLSSRRSYAAIPDRPLIDRVTNEWRNNPEYTRYDKNEYEEDEYGQIVPKNRQTWANAHLSRTSRYFGLYVLFLFAFLYYWQGWMQPGWASRDRLDMSLYRSSMPNLQFGLNARPEFADMKQIEYLETENIPGRTHASKKRLVVVGDVHGCKDELASLLEKISFHQKHDHLVLAGDMIFKGPDSGGVVDLAKSVGASCVRGNHEDRTLLAYASMHGHAAVAAPTVVPQSSSSDDKAEAKPAQAHGIDSNSVHPPPKDNRRVHSDNKHLTLAKQLTTSQIHWLQQCPCVLNIGLIGKKRDYVVVHAGLAPGIRLEQQDPFNVMNMRTIDLLTRVPSELRDGGEPWTRVWNHYQSKLDKSIQRKTVVYGHDSKTGLSMLKYTRGLDTGCVSGGKLTALVIDAKGKERLVSVKCKNYRS